VATSVAKKRLKSLLQTLLLTEKILDPSVAPFTSEDARVTHLSQQIRGAVLINGEQLATGVVVETLVGLQIGEDLFLVGSRFREVGFVRLEGAIDFHRGETEHATSFINIAPALREGTSDEQFSGFISVQAFDWRGFDDTRRRFAILWLRARHEMQVFRSDYSATTLDEGVFNDILQFPDVAGEVVGEQRLERFRTHRGFRTAHFDGEHRQKVFH